MYYLELEYDGKIISIPFGKLKDIDQYTMGYSDRKSFLNNLIAILGFDIDINFVDKVYLVDEENRLNGFNYEDCLPIRYSRDNYNVDSLRENFIYYLQKDHNRIRRFDIVHVKLSSMMDFKDRKRDISDDEIRQCVDAYFKEHYKAIRQIYFDISDECNIKIDKFEVSKKNIKRDNLSKIKSEEDDYLQYLIECFSRSEEDRLRAREELALMDIDELMGKLEGYSSGLLDGLTDIDSVKSKELDDERIELEYLVGMNIDEIRQGTLKRLGRYRR